MRCAEFDVVQTVESRFCTLLHNVSTTWQFAYCHDGALYGHIDDTENDPCQHESLLSYKSSQIPRTRRNLEFVVTN